MSVCADTTLSTAMQVGPCVVCRCPCMRVRARGCGYVCMCVCTCVCVCVCMHVSACLWAATCVAESQNPTLKPTRRASHRLVADCVSRLAADQHYNVCCLH